jgi:modification methylase
MFPEELPRRLIKMFTFVGDTVLDPFLGSGTTVKAALELGRNAVGYEINADFLAIIQEKLGLKDRLPFDEALRIVMRAEADIDLAPVNYTPRLGNAMPLSDPDASAYRRDDLPKVVQIVDEITIRLDNGQMVRFFGVEINKAQETLRYLHERLLGKRVLVKHLAPGDAPGAPSTAQIYLKNKLHINGYLVKSGLASLCLTPPAPPPHRPAPPVPPR